MKPDITLQELLGWDGVSSLRADLHSHSTISDGSYSSGELLEQAKHKGLTHLAITNHDTTVGFNQAREAVKNINAAEQEQDGLQEGGFPLTYISGVEISAWNPKTGRKVHILGFGLEEDSPAISALCTPLLEARTNNTLWQQEQLEQAGYTLNKELLSKLRLASTGFYKQHLMAALTNAPFTSQEYQSLYKRLFKGDGICKRDISYVHMCDAVRAICEDGGVAVLAHPGQLDSYSAVPELVDEGLWGIEKYHPDHTELDWDRCDQMASDYALTCTGGSDYHGAFGEEKCLGQCMLKKLV